MSDLSAYGKGIELAIASLMPPDERRAQIQAAADDLLKHTQEELRAAGTLGPARYKTFVDGQEAETLDRVNLDHGEIRFRFAGGVPVDVVESVLEMVRANSPVVTGAYRDSHRVYADKRDVTEAMPSEDEAERIKEFAIMPTVPYARKLETLKGVYEATTSVAQRRFGNRAGVYFEFRSPILPYVAGAANREDRQRLRGQQSRIKAIRASRETRMPCIFIVPLD